MMSTIILSKCHYDLNCCAYNNYGKCSVEECPFDAEGFHAYIDENISIKTRDPLFMRCFSVYIDRALPPTVFFSSKIHRYLKRSFVKTYVHESIHEKINRVFGVESEIFYGVYLQYYRKRLIVSGSTTPIIANSLFSLIITEFFHMTLEVIELCVRLSVRNFLINARITLYNLFLEIKEIKRYIRNRIHIQKK